MDPAQFKQLKLKWYRKLKDSGFNDIEDTESPKEVLKLWDSVQFRRERTIKTFREKHRYYQMTTYFATSHTFSSKFEERVWCMHSEGFPCREIAKKLKSNKDTVHKVIKTLIKIMRGY